MVSIVTQDKKSKASKTKEQSQKVNTVQHSMYTLGCVFEDMFEDLTKQLVTAKVDNAPEVAANMLKQSFNNALISIQIKASLTSEQPTRKIGFQAPVSTESNSISK